MPNRLTDAQFEQFRRHVGDGCDLERQYNEELRLRQQESGQAEAPIANDPFVFPVSTSRFSSINRVKWLFTDWDTFTAQLDNALSYHYQYKTRDFRFLLNCIDIMVAKLESGSNNFPTKMKAATRVLRIERMKKARLSFLFQQARNQKASITLTFTPPTLEEWLSIPGVERKDTLILQPSMFRINDNQMSPTRSTPITIRVSKLLYKMLQEKQVPSFNVTELNQREWPIVELLQLNKLISAIDDKKARATTTPFKVKDHFTFPSRSELISIGFRPSSYSRADLVKGQVTLYKEQASLFSSSKIDWFDHKMVRIKNEQEKVLYLPTDLVNAIIQQRAGEQK